MNKSVHLKEDKKMGVWMSRILRTGVLSSAVIIITGGIFYFIQHPHSLFVYDTFINEPTRLKHVPEIIREAFAFRSRTIIQFGILVLIATPVIRVIFSMIGFIAEKDWKFVIVTGIVTLILLFSLFGTSILY